MKNNLLKITTLSIFAAIGSILMMPFLEIPYPIAPMLMIEFSDVIVLLTFGIFGLKEAFFVALLKTITNLLIRGPVGPIAIGQITALITSLSYCLALFLSKKIFKIKNKIFTSAVIVLIVTIILTVCNYLFITPIYLGGTSFLDFWKIELEIFKIKGSYLEVILLLYVPFNLLKGCLVTIVYFLLIKRLRELINIRILKKDDLMENNNKFFIFCDLDDTLLTKDKKITKKSKKYIKKIIDEGHKFIINTGRPLAGCFSYFEFLGENYPIITDNGSCIYLSKDENHFFDLNKEIFLDIISQTEKYIIWGVLGTETTTCFYNHEKLPFWLDHRNVKFKELHGSFLETVKENPIHGTIAIKKEDELEFEKIIYQEKYKDISFFKWQESKDFIDYEFASPMASKGNAIKYIIEHFNVDINNTVAFGDGLNDLSMMDAVNHSYAMINSNETLKGKVKYITSYDFNHNGVIKEIKKLIDKQ